MCSTDSVSWSEQSFISYESRRVPFVGVMLVTEKGSKETQSTIYIFEIATDVV